MEHTKDYADLLNIMRVQGAKDNPILLQLGVMQGPRRVKIGDLFLDSEDLYLASHLVEGYSGERSLGDAGGLKAGDVVAVMKLHHMEKYVILSKVVRA